MNNQSLTTKVTRYILGVIILVFGLNGFFDFLPMPPLPASANEFLHGLQETGYMNALIYGSELVIGVLLLIRRFVPLALLLFAPIALNILFFHLFLAPAEGVIGYITVILFVWQLFAHKSSYQSVLKSGTG